jgi:predicted TIM-barrel fold metal-dependent hydrolase
MDRARIEAMTNAPSQKRDILYNNAARFLRLNTSGGGGR